MRLRAILSISAAMAASLFTTTAGAALFLSTGDTGQSVQCADTETRWWTFSVDQTVAGLDGGLFSMKDGPNTVADITFTLIEGDYADYGNAPVLLNTTLANSNFLDKNFGWVEFASTAITLEANRLYTAVLYTSAPKNRKYFLRSGRLTLVDETGAPVLPGVTITLGAASADASVPEPTSLALAGLVPLGLMARWRRR